MPENYVGTIHGRDVVHELTFAATKDGKITAVKSEAWCAMGAYLELVTPGIPILGAWIYSGPYEIPNYSVTFTGVFTHTTPTDAYRGAGRPEATYVLERTMDALARELGMDPLELRRRNFVSEFPHTMASGLTIDSGDYHASLDRLLELLDLDAIRAEQAERRSNGDAKQIGVGFSTYNEMCGLAPSRILGAIRYAGRVGLRHRSASSRSGPSRSSWGRRRTARATRRRSPRSSPTSSGERRRRRGAARRHCRVAARHGHVRQPLAAVGGIALFNASQKIIDKARRIVAHQLEVSEDDLEFESGSFSVKGSPDRNMTIQDAAFAAHAAHNSRTEWSRGSRSRPRTIRPTSPGRRGARSGRRGRHRDR